MLLKKHNTSRYPIKGAIQSHGFGIHRNLDTLPGEFSIHISTIQALERPTKVNTM